MPLLRYLAVGMVNQINALRQAGGLARTVQ